MDIHSIRNSAHNNWLLPGTAILGGQTAAEWQNWVLHYFCVLVRPHDLSCLCSTWAERGCRGMEELQQGTWEGWTSMSRAWERNWDPWEAGMRALAMLWAVLLGCWRALCAQRSCSAGFPLRRTKWGKFSGNLSFLLLIICFIPCPEFSCCSPFHCQLWQYQCKSHLLPSPTRVPSFCHRGGVWELIVTVGLWEQCFPVNLLQQRFQNWLWNLWSVNLPCEEIIARWFSFLFSWLVRSVVWGMKNSG